MKRWLQEKATSMRGVGSNLEFNFTLAPLLEHYAT